MTISELICQLHQIKCEHGDLPVLSMGEDWEITKLIIVRCNNCLLAYPAT